MGTLTRRKMIAGSAGASLAAALPRFARAASYDPGASDSEIRVGQFGPLSGPVSSFGVLATAMAAYFKMLNESGGINGRKVTFINYDDAYSPPKSVEAARKLVESDEVLLIAGSMGTPGNLAIQKYMNAKKVPQLFLAAGASKLADPAHYPWTMIYASTFEREGAVAGKYLASSMPQAKIAVLYQDDDAGRATLGTLRASLGASGPKIVSEMTYNVTDPTIDSQLVQMKVSGADVVVLNTIPRMASQALQKFYVMDWHPQIFLGAGNASVTATLKPAGFEKAQGALAFATSQDPGNPIWDDQPGMKQYRAFLSRYAPTADAASGMFAAGYSIAYTVAHVLRQCGNDLTRANVLKEATSLKDFATPLLIPGITMNTSPTDYVPIKRYQLMRFKGEQYERVGDPVASD
ncbi:ABC transporter substrate-binding protein [Bradyrhizobium sp. BR13661]|jgi:branched-chain amino acid transport system substrate-binding protein|uniref:ABC transporter substrate-binding protein n=2 Tax=Pseudomonadota TaxID=1224 RepID=UPI00247331B5|nr:ABC transporter substrate-binding protein [Bradyrhizobium sp. BR13661]MDH6260548.1 branched-chain amino acid transport system substrate-binding protein [Bradyrhizobium sp. BR13661]